MEQKLVFIFTIFSMISLFFQTGERRKVLQFHYIAWPDFGVPQDPETFLQFLKDIKKKDVLYNINNPPVIHCRCVLFVIMYLIFP